MKASTNRGSLNKNSSFLVNIIWELWWLSRYNLGYLYICSSDVIMPKI